MGRGMDVLNVLIFNIYYRQREVLSSQLSRGHEVEIILICTDMIVVNYVS